MAVMVVVALDPGMTLWGLNQLKNELLGQVAPLFVLGVSWRGLKAKPALLGIVLGTLAAVIPTLAGWERLWGFHAGVLGLALNVLVGVAGSLWVNARERRRALRSSASRRQPGAVRSAGSIGRQPDAHT